MGIELSMPFEKKAIGQILEELAKGKKWKRCVISVETNGPTGSGRFAYHNLRIQELKEKNGRFDLGLVPAQRGMLNWGRKDFFYPGRKDEDGGGRKPILALLVQGFVKTPKKKKK